MRFKIQYSSPALEISPNTFISDKSKILSRESSKVLPAYLIFFKSYKYNELLHQTL